MTNFTQLEVDRLGKSAYDVWVTRRRVHDFNEQHPEWKDLDDFDKDTFRQIAGAVLAAHANRRKQ